MRTTVSIDDDVFFAVRERATRTGKTVGEVLTDLARTALARDSEASPGAFHGFTPLRSRGRPVTNADIDSLREDCGE